MKKLLFILLLSVSGLQAQNYTVYDPVTYEVRYVCSVAICGNAPENSTPLMVTENWCCSYYNPTLNVLYNNATPEQQALFLAQQQASLTNPDDMIGFNDALITPQTDTMLNVLYTYQKYGFILVCQNVTMPNFPGTQTIYIKGKNGKWNYLMTFKNKEN